MEMTGNTMLITGGGSGIGRGLAERFGKLGNHVVIAGRRRETLEEVVRANPGMAAVTMDVGDAESVKAATKEIEERFPKLSVVIHNAGIMRPENLQGLAEETPEAAAMVATNLLGPMHLTAALLPLLKKQGKSTVMTVTSGLAFVPLAMTPTYCATKAGLHSWTESLRWQLRGTGVEVVELIPPYVQTELMGPAQKVDPRAMPLQEFLDEVMGILAHGKVAEVGVERVKGMRFAAEGRTYAEVFSGMNEAMAKVP